jgi:hypothetical protein
VAEVGGGRVGSAGDGVLAPALLPALLPALGLATNVLTMGEVIFVPIAAPLG